MQNTTVELYFRHAFDDRTQAGISIDHIGLYEIVESEYGAYFAIAEEPIQGVTKVEGVGDGQRVYISGKYENLDDAVITKYTGSKTSGEPETVKANTLNKESIVVYQRNEAGKIVALYDLWIELDISVEAEDTDGETVALKDIKGLDTPDTTWYLGKTPDAKNPIELTIPKYWDLKNVEAEDAVEITGKSSELSGIDKNGDFTVKGEDHHDTPASFEINTTKQVWGDVTITIVVDPEHDSTWLKAVEPETNNNLTVSVEGTEITLGGTNTTPTVGDLLLWLDAECDEVDERYCDHATIEVFDNTPANGVVSDDTQITTDNVDNLYVKVTSEKGTVKTYTIVFESAAADDGADGNG